MNPNKIYFGRGHAKRGATNGLVDILTPKRGGEYADSIHGNDMTQRKKWVVIHAVRAGE